jgi:ADP-dependent NAD(P)H-hydrate dehydratase / NAD(P)H-hydrate epimerase
MRYGHTVQAVRRAESAVMARLPEGALMRRAAAGLAVVCADLLGRVYGARTVVLVGSGANGGDALFAAARLARRGAAATAVLLAPDRTHPEGLAAFRAAGGRTVAAEDGAAVIARADLVLDGITGIGGKGGLRAQAVPLAEAAHESRATVIAVDLPSGVDADTGEVHGPAVRADATATFGTYKPALLIDPAAERAGALRLIDIGIDDDLGAPELQALQHADVAALLPHPSGESDKYRRGVVGIAAGSERYPGAAVLAVSSALRGGAGAVRYAGPGGAAVLARHPETLVTNGSPHSAGRVQAWVVGPGLGDSTEARTAVDQVLAADVPALVDADGLRLLTPEAVRRRAAATVLTPHAGEAAALLGWPREDVEARRLDAVRALAARFGATVLLKGSTTLVASPEPGTPVRVNSTGTPWLATAGSGDILSGLTGSLLAAGLSPLDAASCGAYLHGLAARLCAVPLAALDLSSSLTTAWGNVRG